jgi:D-beta-D-heptose 7-phosphate kinase/D-beta-D-heptose 1-phosphate adenosyltransferase
MRHGEMGKIVLMSELERHRRAARRAGRKFVFTNGTFDILHRGHVEYLMRAKKMGDLLAVGLNTDASIRRIRGKGRPINKAEDRAAILAALASVDFVCFFSENTPARMISRLKPDVLVKGADWNKNEIVGRKDVLDSGGTVKRIRLMPGRSTTGLIRRILRNYGTARDGLTSGGRRR